MPDIRTLLDDVTSRPPSPDPVGAVHARVRRRAARRRAGAAAATTLAVATAGLVATNVGGGAGGLPPAATPSPSQPPGTKLDTTWRHPNFSGEPIAHREGDDTYDKLVALVRAHDDVFLGFDVHHEGDLSNGFTLSYAAGVKPSDWDDDVSDTGAFAWEGEVCDHPAVHYDAIAGDLLSVDWPSGAELREDSLNGYRGVGYDGGCQVVAELAVTRPSPADVAYARGRWGNDVLVVGRGQR